jgi:hypothetical protein
MNGFSNFAFNFNLRRYGADPANSERLAVRFADGSEVKASLLSARSTHQLAPFSPPPWLLTT